jgi:hypothetical protein
MSEFLFSHFKTDIKGSSDESKRRPNCYSSPADSCADSSRIAACHASERRAGCETDWRSRRRNRCSAFVRGPSGRTRRRGSESRRFSARFGCEFSGRTRRSIASATGSGLISARKARHTRWASSSRFMPPPARSEFYLCRALPLRARAVSPKALWKSSWAVPAGSD